MTGRCRFAAVLVSAGCLTPWAHAENLERRFWEVHAQPVVEQVTDGAFRGRWRDFSDRRLALQRTACRGRCPEYSLSVSGDGTVEYEGVAHVPLLGRHIGAVDHFEIDVLFEYAESRSLWALKDGFVSGATDSSSTFVLIKMGAREKMIWNEGQAAPIALLVLEELIDGVLESVTGSE